MGIISLWFVHSMAIVLGTVIYLILLALIDDIILFYFLCIVLYSLSGFLFGLKWHEYSYRWGILLSIPLWLVSISMNFIDSGDLSSFLLRLLPPFVIGLTGSIASLKGSQRSLRKAKQKEDDAILMFLKKR